MSSQEEYSALWEEANQSVQSAIRVAEQAYLALEKAKVSQIAYDIQHADIEYQKAIKQVQAAQQHLPYVSSEQQEQLSQAEERLDQGSPQIQ
jgi:lipopolysaccharide biosynthesis regulator YciM